MSNPIRTWLRQRRVKKRQQKLAGLSTDEVFDEIYKKNKWGDPDSASGKGSNLLQTATLRAELPVLLKRYGIQSILDLPCGDFFWMREIDLTGIQYIGADIVDSLTADNRHKYGSENRQFETLNLIEDQLPKVDLIFVRDCLVHLSEDKVFKALNNIKASGSTYLLTTDFPMTSENINIMTGQWRRINLLKQPFMLPEPADQIVENCTEDSGGFSDKRMALWRIENIPTY